MTSGSINGLVNEIANPEGRRLADTAFLELLDIMKTLQNGGVFGMHVAGTEEEPTIAVYFPEEIPDAALRRSVESFKQLLNLDQDSSSFSIHYGLIQENDTGIFVQTRSILEILSGLSWRTDVPQEHIDEGKTLSTFRPASSTPLLSILSTKDKPESAFTLVKTRDYWYYIDDRDMQSKTTFGIIQVLMSLSEDDSRGVGPLISIGN